MVLKKLYYWPPFSEKKKYLPLTEKFEVTKQTQFQLWSRNNNWTETQLSIQQKFQISFIVTFLMVYCYKHKKDYDCIEQIPAIISK